MELHTNIALPLGKCSFMFLILFPVAYRNFKIREMLTLVTQNDTHTHTHTHTHTVNIHSLDFACVMKTTEANFHISAMKRIYSLLCIAANDFPVIYVYSVYMYNLLV